MPGYTVAQIHDMRQRRICTKSHYKMTCECCGKTIHRGDEITQMLGCVGRMRGRGVEFTDGAADAVKGRNTPYGYAPTRNKWVHLTCRPQYFQNWQWSPGYVCIPTAYSEHLEVRRAIAANDPDWGEDFGAIPWPKWTYQRERIAKAAIPLQRMIKKKWRKIYRERWTKKVRDAAIALDTARAEATSRSLVCNMWQKNILQNLKKRTGYGGFLRLQVHRGNGGILNAGERRCGYRKPTPTLPPGLDCTYKKQWCEKVNAAVKVLIYAELEIEHVWQEKMLRDIALKI